MKSQSIPLTLPVHSHYRPHQHQTPTSSSSSSMPSPTYTVWSHFITYANTHTHSSFAGRARKEAICLNFLSSLCECVHCICISGCMSAVVPTSKPNNIHSDVQLLHGGYYLQNSDQQSELTKRHQLFFFFFLSLA